jgi:KipI family sensor histidine kinase inhibitor
MRLLPCGDRAVLVEVADTTEALALYASLREDPLPGVVDLVPAARTVLVTFENPSRTAAAADLAHRPLNTTVRHQPRAVQIPVSYDGPDLAEVASLAGLTEEDVAARHRDTTYIVGFIGFAPGFAYLTGRDPALHVPRRATPRTRVPAGSVAVAGPYTAVYPAQSPGGWRIVGHTVLALWDLDRDPPSLLRPGDRVRFVEAPGAPS